MSRPLFLIDVDGVLSPYAAPACPPGYAEHQFFPGEEPVRLCAGHGVWFQELAVAFELAWATAWGAHANRLLSPILGLAALPVVKFAVPPFPAGYKLEPVRQFAGDRPLAWIDDAFTPEMHAWADGREAPTLLIDIDPALGLTHPVIDQALRWAGELT